MLREAFDQVDLEAGPNVMFAYTLKGWMLPSVGDPQNHSVTLNHEQMESMRLTLGIGEGEIAAGFDPNSEAGKACTETGRRLRPHPPSSSPPDLHIPNGFGRTYRGMMSTQQIFGLVLTDISRNVPEVAERMLSLKPRRGPAHHQPGGLDQQGGHLGQDRPGGDARRTGAQGAPVGRVRTRPAP